MTETYFLIKNKKTLMYRVLKYIITTAEREGFEPSIPFGIHAFQACALDQLCDLSALITIKKIYYFLPSLDHPAQGGSI